eukprot:1131916-Rhodomonas_salina.1
MRKTCQSVPTSGEPGDARCTGVPAIRGICTSALTTSSSRKELPQAVPRNNGTTSSAAAMWCGVVQTKAPSALGP